MRLSLRRKKLRRKKLRRKNMTLECGAALGMPWWSPVCQCQDTNVSGRQVALGADEVWRAPLKFGDGQELRIGYRLVKLLILVKGRAALGFGKPPA
jgi:hypothetical protein